MANNKYGISITLTLEDEGGMSLHGEVIKNGEVTPIKDVKNIIEAFHHMGEMINVIESEELEPDGVRIVEVGKSLKDLS